ncbi:MAG: ADP-ribosylglycohydrolase family protein [Armatimonadetes bacterium]|nr:ADP-ribosylglycohydrolase family protein [Armatimonadota bacterium]
MKPITISETEYRDKVYACWLGKNIGGTLGAPYEGRKEAHNLTYYDPLPSGSAANDDLDLQLVWLKMLQERGINPRLQDFADYWMKHLYPYPWDEYGFCQRNLQRGLRPPISGCFENDFIDQMGSPIRSEIWACIAPGDPQLAAIMAWKDAVLDHAGGEGVWGEMFWAAVESAAFVINDPLKLIQIGLSMIPIWSHISRAVNSAVWCYHNNIPWEQAREKILNRFGHNHPCHAPQNHGFTIIGWLYGKDYGDKLCKAVNCGYDTDCTGATLGSVLGILGGTKNIPKEWSDPVREGIVLHKFTQKLDAPKTIAELTEQTVEIGKKVLSQRSKISMVGESTKVPPNILHIYSINEKARTLWKRDMESATIPISKDMEVTLHYHGDPVIKPGVPKVLSITVERNEEPIPANAMLEFPSDWHVKPIESSELEMAYEVFADNPVDSNTIKAKVEIGADKFESNFIILGPNTGKDWQPAAGVPHCPKCGARIEACLCPK